MSGSDVLKNDAFSHQDMSEKAGWRLEMPLKTVGRL